MVRQKKTTTTAAAAAAAATTTTIRLSTFLVQSLQPLVGGRGKKSEDNGNVTWFQDVRQLEKIPAGKRDLQVQQKRDRCK